MKNIYFLVLWTICMLCIAGNAFAEKPKWMEAPTGKLVEEARNSTQQVPITELKKVVDADEDIILLDVRTPKEYEAVHIPGAVNISRGLLEFSIWSVVPDKNEKIYVYCKSGARAALATKQLNDFGYKNAVAIATGMTDWAKSGYAVQTSITDEQIIILHTDE